MKEEGREKISGYEEDGERGGGRKRRGGRRRDGVKGARGGGRGRG